jgi:hypothetical protein
MRSVDIDDRIDVRVLHRVTRGLECDTPTALNPNALGERGQRGVINPQHFNRCVGQSRAGSS